MTRARAVTLTWPVALVAAILLLAAGGIIATRWRPVAGDASPAAGAASAPSAPGAATSATGDITITLSPETTANAHLETAEVTASTDRDTIEAPGTVTANAYAETRVNALAAGRVTRVVAELGDRVQRGALLAEIYSPELAAAQTAFLSMQADLASVRQELLRTERMAAIGSASTQELEKANAEHARYAAGTKSARATLTLLGMSDEAMARLEQTGTVDATTPVTAPQSGEITMRQINEGTTVPSGADLFTVTDLSTVWVIAHVYENDIARIHTGATASVTVPGSSAPPIEGRVTYIDPQVSADTRTAQVRIQAPNRGALRLAMYVAVTIAAGGDVTALSVPASAIQQIGSQHVVYVQGSAPGQFSERSVTVGTSRSGRVQVQGRLKASDRVVTSGSFLLRSERERLGLRAPDPIVPAAAPGRAQRTEIAVTADGFSPPEITVNKGEPVELVFQRTTDGTCATQVVFPGLKITKDLPLNTPVSITWTPAEAGTVAFACGMKMFNGSVVVK